MRIMTIVVTGMLATLVAFPAVAQKRADSQVASPPSWDQCYDQALKHGLMRSRKGHDEYMRECQGGRIPGFARASRGASVALSFEQCEARALALGMPHGQAGHVEYVRECMGKRPGNSNIAGRSGG